MITYVKGDMFSSPAKILVNAVNTVGVMGKGIALEFKKKYPEMFYEYQELCKTHKFDIGSLFLWRKSEKWVMLFPTKKHWRQPSQIEYIEAGLQKFVQNWDKMGADTIAFPRLGCGNGALDWDDVRPVMEKYLERLPIQVYVYVGNYNDPEAEHLHVTEMEKWMSGEAMLEGFERFQFKLKKVFENAEQNILPANHSYKWKNEGLVSIDEVSVDEKTVCDFWNYIRDAGIVCTDEIPREYEKIASGFFELLLSLRYVSSVFVSKDGVEFKRKPNAYQYIAD